MSSTGELPLSSEDPIAWKPGCRAQGHRLGPAFGCANRECGAGEAPTATLSNLARVDASLAT